MPNNFSTKAIYDSFEMFHPDGTFMCFCDKKRAYWYVNRGLASWVDEENGKFKLFFEPQGKGKSDSIYYTQKIENKCVVCGATHELNKHHVVPYVFRSRFPKELKESNHHDILPICIDCHEEYEEIANEYKKEIVEGLGGSFHQKPSKEETERKKTKSVMVLLSKIKSGEVVGIPEERQEKLKALVNDNQHIFFDVKEEVKISHWADLVIGSLNSEEDIYSFMVMWRKHFIKEMKPRFLPDNWSVDFKLEKARIN
jgi:hypothetical protein